MTIDPLPRRDHAVDDRLVLSPSWPSSSGSRRQPVTDSVNRRVLAAERRAVRRAVALGGTLVGLLLLTDMAANLLIGTPGIWRLAPVSAAAAAVCIAVAFAVRRSTWPAEPFAVVVMVAVLSAALLGLALMPADALLAAAEVATILVGAGLFLPWDRRWHAGAVAVSVLVIGAVLVSPLPAGLDAAGRIGFMVGALMAAVTSVIGHGLWYARFRGMLAQQFELRSLSRYAQRQESHVLELNRELNRVARRDSLTGIGNRLALDEAMARLLDQGDRLRPARFAIVLFDIDHFKAYNDEHGHLAGDAALGRLGEILRRATRSDDLAFRYGGEEFLLLLPEVDLPGAIAVGDRVRLAAAERPPDGIPPFTVSGGVALCDPGDGRDPEPLLRRADTALYLAKRAGRDRIMADELSVAMQRDALASTG